MAEKDETEEGAGGPRGRRAFLVRLAPELHDQLRAWAAAELRSLNAHVEYLLREAVRRRRGSRDESDDSRS